ncbi:VOC family protein [Leptolyngbya cf. ectocarpi LEGE 11479]|uniref:VOC family protein n=1 Tax=Leptolyngbya cf. ectocarpi LEGE 11479 TaxID=1828722 RepID=A0A928X239_LEPEC|nr:VOC family protein [Leptolyngbya ectocarpi]MBE9065643.1 VOC family protein [Leptolyngbya cf. ectocarpi LEGE 11479]
MGIRDSYENGVFSWVDLITSDQDAAKQFYAELFAWTFQDMPVDTGGIYSMAFKGGRPVAAVFAAPDDQQGPPHWNGYITVKDLDATVQTWQHQGGNVAMPSCDIMDSGRMAMVQDPTGAFVGLWQAKEFVGAGLVNEVNTFCWTELQTRGADKAAEFYQAVFGWELEVDEKPPNYITASVKGRMNCGMFDMDKAKLPAEIPSRWAVYFNVADLDESLAAINRLGGKVLMDPIDIEPGRFTTVMDPQGATLALMQVNDPDD